MNRREIDTSCAVSRAESQGLNAILGHAYPVLDHGFVRAIDYLGNDAAIVQMARVSYGSGTKSVSTDRALIRYLLKHYHSSPFEGCEIKLHVKLPVFVARQWIRHRTANVNEYSARYSILDGEFYIPEPEHLAMQSQDNKQGRSAVLPPDVAETVRRWLIEDASRSYQTYSNLIDDPDEGGIGLARELARMNLPVNIYTQWYWKVDLHNLFHFLRLRADAHAQYEIRVYADAIANLVQTWVPHAFEAWVDYQRDAVQFSRMEMAILKDAFRGYQISPKVADAVGLTKREIADFAKKFQ